MTPSEWSRSMLHLAENLKAAAEPAYEETQTIEIWNQFLLKRDISITWALRGKSPVIDFGSYRDASVKIIVTADLDAVGISMGDSWTCEHLCGHYAQSVHVLGLADLLTTYTLNKDMAVRIIGCPAEECRPIYDFQYPLPFQTGKQKLLQEGWFDGATAVLSTHLADNLPTRAVQLVQNANGLIGVRLASPAFDPWREEGATLQTHASFLEKWQGVIREATGQPEVKVRTRAMRSGIELWTEIPPNVDKRYRPFAHEVLESLQRETSFGVELISEYAPLLQHEGLRNNAKQVISMDGNKIEIYSLKSLPGSTDLGDVSQHYPAFQLFVGGTVGHTHSPTFRVVDETFAHLWPIHWCMNMIEALTKNI